MVNTILKARPNSLFHTHQQVLMFYIDEKGIVVEPRTSYQAALLSLPPPISSHLHSRICLAFHTLSQSGEIFSLADMM